MYALRPRSASATRNATRNATRSAVEASRGSRPGCRSPHQPRKVRRYRSRCRRVSGRVLQPRVRDRRTRRSAPCYPGSGQRPWTNPVTPWRTGAQRSSPACGQTRRDRNPVRSRVGPPRTGMRTERPQNTGKPGLRSAGVTVNVWVSVTLRAHASTIGDGLLVHRHAVQPVAVTTLKTRRSPRYP